MRWRALTLGVVGTMMVAAGSASAATWRWAVPVNLTNPIGGLSVLSAGEVQCPSTHLCLAETGAALWTSTVPTGGRSAWTKSAITVAPLGVGFPAGIVSLSCPDTHLCVATTELTGLYASTDPSAGGASWHPAGGNTEPSPGGYGDPINLATDVVCPSTALCVATTVRAGGAGVVTTTDPGSSAPHWTETPIGPPCDSSGSTCIDNPHGLACPSTRLCVAVNGTDDVIVSSDPGARRWTSIPVRPSRDLAAVSCASARLCVADDGTRGDVYVSTDPTGGSRAWHRTTPGLRTAWLQCPVASLCLANQDDAFPYASADVTGGGQTWRPASIDPAGVLESVACATATNCVAIDDAGDIVTGAATAGPVPTASPDVRGATVVGSVLAALSGRFSGTAPVSLMLRWERCAPDCVPIAGATGPRYRVGPADVGSSLRVRVTAYNRDGSAVAFSPQTARIRGGAS